MSEDMHGTLRKHRLRWLGYLVRMGDTRLPKQLLFGELTKVRPGHGTKRRWRDLAVADVRAVNLEGKWCEVAQDKGRWWKECDESANSKLKKQSHPSQQLRDTYNCACGRNFRRQGDLTRHKRFCSRPQ